MRDFTSRSPARSVYHRLTMFRVDEVEYHHTTGYKSRSVEIHSWRCVDLKFGNVARIADENGEAQPFCTCRPANHRRFRLLASKYVCRLVTCNIHVDVPSRGCLQSAQPQTSLIWTSDLAHRYIAVQTPKNAGRWRYHGLMTRLRCLEKIFRH
jgi:hypothetical protein